MKRIFLWSGPRNVSTALMYSFRQRDDTVVVDEPLYGHYLLAANAPHPGRALVIEATDCDGKRVVHNLMNRPYDRPVLFVKSMAHHLIGLDTSFLAEVQNVILTRDPRDMLPSLAERLGRPTIEDTALPQQLALLRELAAMGTDVPVLDARLLLDDPPGVVRVLCDRLGLTFQSDMLGWPPGPKPEDGVWAPLWYDSVHLSTGFAPYRRRSGDLDPDMETLARQCMPLYEDLLAQAIATETS